MIDKGYSAAEIDAAFDRVAQRTGRKYVALTDDINEELKRGRSTARIKQDCPVVDSHGMAWRTTEYATRYGSSPVFPVTALITTTTAKRLLDDTIDSFGNLFDVGDQIAIHFAAALAEETEVQP